MQKNSTILASAWIEGGNDYQQRIPSPDVATQAQTMRAIFDPMNASAYNAFVSTLINRIGMTYARQQEWRNPLAAFGKRGELPFGTTVQELQTAWVRAHSYEDDKLTLLKVHRPEVKAVYHELNREDQYPISLNRVELRRAFTEETGLNSLVASVMQAPINSEAYDEYRSMLQLISFYENAWGFYKIQAALPDDDTTAKGFLKSLKTMVAKLAFPSARYNAQILDDIAVFAKPQEMILLITPEASASVDVDALATLFHLEPTDAQVRKVIVDEFPIPGAYAMLTTQDWFQVYDVERSNGSFYNPETLTTNYYYTVMQVISCSPFVPAIVWTTEAGTETKTIVQTVPSNVVTAGAFRRNANGGLDALDTAEFTPTEIKAGRAYVLGTKLTGTLSDGDVEGEKIGEIEVKPRAMVPTGYAFSNGITANSRTYLDRNGRLHLQAAALRATEDITLTISYVSAYENPSGETPEATVSTFDVTIKTEAEAAPTMPSATIAYKLVDGEVTDLGNVTYNAGGPGYDFTIEVAAGQQLDQILVTNAADGSIFNARIYDEGGNEICSLADGPGGWSVEASQYPTLTAVGTNRDTLSITWNIAPGYAPSQSIGLTIIVED